jgi:cell division protein FtsI/penicillin-binding protein 2
VSKRIGILFGGIALVFCLLAGRLFQLQIRSGKAARPAGFDEARTVVLPAARGAIFDRDGKLLRATRDAFDVTVTASTFREKNLADALADLSVLLGGMPADSGPIERGRLVQELAGKEPAPAIQRILALEPAPALADEADDLHGRARVLVEPEGTLVRPATHVRRRIQDAILVVAGESGRTPRVIRTRMRERGATVADVAGVDAAGVEARLAAEGGLLGHLGAELGLGDAAEVRAWLDHLCDRHYGRVEEKIEERVDDAICLQDFGSWNLAEAGFSEDEAAELRAQAGVAANAPWKDVRPALCRQVRSAPGFERSRYMDARKESQSRTELAAFRNDEFGFGGTFGVATLVDGPGGLRRLGFELAASFARDPARRHPGGVLALLLGEVTRRGKATGGLEAHLDEVLCGAPGEARIGEGEAVVVKEARHGKNVKLTLSLALQERVQAALTRIGAAAVVDVRTGGILAAATWPLPTDREAAGALAELDELKTRRGELVTRWRAGDGRAEPLLASVRERINNSPAVHRAVTFESNIPPGSVMKALTLLAGLEAGVIHPAFEIDCQTSPDGRQTLPDGRSTKPPGHFGCHRHGRVDVELALEMSCNEYCYQTAGLLGGASRLFSLYETLGAFDAVPGMIGRRDGAYMRGAIKNDDPKNLAIGQGSLSLAPVRLAGFAASLAAGRVVRPHLWAPDGFEPVGGAFAQEENLNAIRSGMRRVVTGARGTAWKSRHLLEPLGVAAKTGTAQLKTVNVEDLYAAWFVGFAPYDSPRYAFAVLIDHTHDEGADAAPIAAKVVDACYEVLGGRP